ncbi:hypothetical protein F5B20DRAFT_589274 [Whalleya microplaca]|nr:hypothetical protein F5B20DRAFT_589274 [Whalleya microplaca]
MSLTGAARRLLRALSAVDSTEKIDSGAEISSASSASSAMGIEPLELELWPVAAPPQPPSPCTITATTSYYNLENVVVPLGQRRHDDRRVPLYELRDLPRSSSTVLRTRKGTIPSSSSPPPPSPLTRRPITRASSIDSTISTDSSSSSNSSGKVSIVGSGDEVTTHCPAATRQQASQLCWREYWGKGEGPPPLGSPPRPRAAQQPTTPPSRPPPGSPPPPPAQRPTRPSGPPPPPRPIRRGAAPPPGGKVPRRVSVRTMIWTGAFAAVTAVGAIYGAGLRTQQEYKAEKKQVLEASVEDRIRGLEEARAGLVKQKLPLEKKLGEAQRRIRAHELKAAEKKAD